MKKKKQIQPTPKKGTSFTGWTTFNWGINHGRVFPTRKQAQEWCANNGKADSRTWSDVKDHFKVVKVKCTVI